MTDRSNRADHYLPGAAYFGLLDEIEAVAPHHRDDMTFCPRPRGVELLGLAGVWPDSCAPVLDSCDRDSGTCSPLDAAPAVDM